jgi:hypothetical protein
MHGCVQKRATHGERVVRRCDFANIVDVFPLVDDGCSLTFGYSVECDWSGVSDRLVRESERTVNVCRRATPHSRADLSGIVGVRDRDVVGSDKRQ